MPHVPIFDGGREIMNPIELLGWLLAVAFVWAILIIALDLL